MIRAARIPVHTYQEKGNPNTRFCFAPGSLPVVCHNIAQIFSFSGFNIEGEVESSTNLQTCRRVGGLIDDYEITPRFPPPPPYFANVDIGTNIVCDAEATVYIPGQNGLICTAFRNINTPNQLEYEVQISGTPPNACQVVPFILPG